MRSTAVSGPWPLVYFTLGLFGLLAIDLGLSARRKAPPSLRTSMIWTAVWLTVAVGFGLWIGWVRGRDDALAFFAAYLTEDSLSLDNMVVFIAVFGFFGVPAALQHRVLFWGIIGAVIMRGLMVAAGIALLDRFSWITYIFGAFLVFAGVRAFIRQPSAEKSERGILRLLSRWIPLAPQCDDAAFFRRTKGHFGVTPLFVALVVIELSDAAFAVDSLPAVFGVTRNPFIVYTSNMLAVLGLRSLFFLVAGVLPELRYLRVGLAAILVFVGGKMLLGDFVEVPIWFSLAFIVLAIAVATVASVAAANRADSRGATP
jgi:tellurite resistance protein TerC